MVPIVTPIDFGAKRGYNLDDADGKRAKKGKRTTAEVQRAEAEAQQTTEAVKPAELEVAAQLAARLRALEAQYGIQSPPHQSH